MAPIIYGRKRELETLERFCEKPGSGFTYVRGRRRIGKSTLLKELEASYENCFYFQGTDDSTDRSTRNTFAQKWDSFTGFSSLTELRDSALSWSRIFREVENYANKIDSMLILILDEIQWMAKSKSGILGSLKEAWLDWKKTESIKVILSGSSNKFFEEHANSAESTLRGLKTFAEIWIHPFSLQEVRKYYCPHWTLEQTCLLYMMLGGVPYYLEQVPYEKENFLRAINEGIFHADSIFLSEVIEVLGIEISTSTEAFQNVLLLLSNLGQDGATETTLQKRTGLSQSSINRILNRLQNYGIVKRKVKIGERHKNQRGTKYCMLDFYLNFYFQVLENLSERISRNNKGGMLFNCETITSKGGYYIPSFSGKAFELLVYTVLSASTERTEPIFKKLKLPDEPFKLGFYWKEGVTQVDLIVESAVDRESRIIEAKWISKKATIDDNYIDQVKTKKYPSPAGYTKSHYLFVSSGYSRGLEKAAEKEHVGLIELSDLFTE